MGLEDAVGGKEGIESANGNFETTNDFCRAHFSLVMANDHKD